MQRDYPWPRPSFAHGVKKPRVWGHGFVAAYFDAIPMRIVVTPLSLSGLRVCDAAAAEGLF